MRVGARFDLRKGLSLARRASRRTQLQVVAFLSRAELLKATSCVPVPFLHKASHPDCPAGLLDATRYHLSCWDQGMLSHTDQSGSWEAAFTPSKVLLKQVACDESKGDAFILFVSDVVNSGSFGGRQPTQNHSLVTGLYRLHLDDTGHITDVWVYRSSTVEEREALLKCEPTLLDTLRSQLKQLLDTPKGPAAAAHCIGNGSSALKAGGDQGNGNGSSSIGGSLTMPLQPLECVWEVEPPQVAAMAQAAEDWSGEVCSQGSLQALMRLVSQDVTLCDGTGLELPGHPLTGASQLCSWLVAKCLKYELGQRGVLSQVTEGNKVFMHWAQPVTCRASGEDSNIDGATMLVFDREGAIAQVFDFHSPTEDQLSELFKEEALQAPPSSSSSPGQGAHPTNGAGGKPSIKEMLAAAEAAEAERREVLARQEREWMSW